MSYDNLTDAQKEIVTIMYNAAWSEAHDLEWDYSNVHQWYNDHRAECHSSNMPIPTAEQQRAKDVAVEQKYREKAEDMINRHLNSDRSRNKAGNYEIHVSERVHKRVPELIKTLLIENRYQFVKMGSRLDGVNTSIWVIEYNY